ncbi:MAG: hypothetical protein V4651_07635 [Bacteroidota bacterium]
MSLQDDFSPKKFRSGRAGKIPSKTNRGIIINRALRVSFLSKPLKALKEGMPPIEESGPDVYRYSTSKLIPRMNDANLLYLLVKYGTNI